MESSVILIPAARRAWRRRLQLVLKAWDIIDFFMKDHRRPRGGTQGGSRKAPRRRPFRYVLENPATGDQY